MKTFIETIVIALMVLMSQMAMAQQEEKTLLRTEQIAARLGLSEAQKTELDAQLKATQKERKERAEQFRKLREEMRRDAFVERQQQREALESILTPEQLEQLKALKAERGDRMRERFRNRRGDQRFDRQRVERFKSQRRMMMKRRLGKGQEEGTDKKDGGN